MVDRSRGFAAALVAAALIVAAPHAFSTSEPSVKELLRFGAEMATKGNWREAKYRWERAAALAGEDPRVLNDLAVAHEALGEWSAAREAYEKALKFSDGDPRIAENLAQLQRFEATTSKETKADDSELPLPTGGGETKGAKTKKVPVQLPVPPRIDVSGIRTVLVVSFLTPGSDLLDTNREVVRFLRSEFRKRTKLEILDVTPAPAVPEQTLEDLARNVEFWRHLGREYSANLLVSGAALFSRRDASGFQEVDMISPVTGQKIRQTRFVEQEQFTFEMDVLYFDGATGGLVHRDRVKRSATYAGLANDPITGIYGLLEALGNDVAAAVAPRTREEFRVIFPK